LIIWVSEYLSTLESRTLLIHRHSSRALSLLSNDSHLFRPLLLSRLSTMPAVVSNATRIWETDIYWDLSSQCGIWDPKRKGVDIWECVRARESYPVIHPSSLILNSLSANPQIFPPPPPNRQTTPTGDMWRDDRLYALSTLPRGHSSHPSLQRSRSLLVSRDARIPTTGLIPWCHSSGAFNAHMRCQFVTSPCPS